MPNTIVTASNRLLPARAASLLAAEVRAADLQAEHVLVAKVELRRAKHWLRHFSVSYPGRAAAIAGHARTAGERMAYAGLPYSVLELACPDVPSTDVACADLIWPAVRDGFFATTALLAAS